MKNIKSILLLMLAIFVVSCVEVEPDYKDFPTKDVDFVFEVEGNEYTTDFYYVSPIKFKKLKVLYIVSTLLVLKSSYPIISPSFWQ